MALPARPPAGAAGKPASGRARVIAAPRARPLAFPVAPHLVGRSDGRHVGRGDGGPPAVRPARQVATADVDSGRRSGRRRRKSGRRGRKTADPQAGPRSPRTRGRCGPRPTGPSPGSRSTCRLPHLDRPFDYLVPERLAEQARPGVRVRVRFAGQLTDGFLIERAEASEHQGSLRYLDRVVSAEQVLTEEIARPGPRRRRPVRGHPRRRAAARGTAAARRHRGGRHEAARRARAPATASRAARLAAAPRPDAGPWARYPAGPSFLDALAGGPPGPRGLDGAARAGLAGGDRARRRHHRERRPWRGDRGPRRARPGPRRRGPGRAHPRGAPGGPGRSPGGQRDRPAGGYVTLTADLGPAERYRRWLAALRGEALIVAGTRAAMFAPGAGPRPGGALGRRRRPACRAPRPVPATRARSSPCAPTAPARPP